MGRPRKLNLTQNSDFNHNVTIQVATIIFSDVLNANLSTDYIFYTDAFMYELPSTKVIIKQLSTILKVESQHIVIKSISL